MTIDQHVRQGEAAPEDVVPGAPLGAWARWRSRLRYGTTLRAKLIVPVFAITCVVIAALFAFAYLALHASITSIYEARARSVAAVISKSIQEKDYILYYSDELDADISRLVEQHESILDITVVGMTARGYVTVASTDPTKVGVIAGRDESARYEALQGSAVERIRTESGAALLVMQPIGSGADQVGVVMIDMSLDEQARYERRLAWQFGAAAAIGVCILCGLLALVLTSVVNRPVRRLAAATQAVAERRYEIGPAPSLTRTPGTAVRDELSQLDDGFHLMATMIHAHEQELRKLVLLDELTGLYNADHFRAQFPIELGKGKRYGHPTSLIVAELRGLEGRDEAEQSRARVRTATFLLSRLRKVDILFRASADRFVGILPETPAAGAAVAAERIRTFASDVTSAFSPPIALDIVSIGWDAESDVTPDDVVRRLTAEGAGTSA